MQVARVLEEGRVVLMVDIEDAGRDRDVMEEMKMVRSRGGK